MRRIVGIIQARMGARRLPGKVLLDLEGKAVLEHVIDRVRRSKLIEDTVAATTIKKEDLKIVRLASKKGVRVYCGQEDDVLDRYFQAALLFDAKHIVRITADCPLIDPGIIDDVIRLYLSKRVDYASNNIKELFPDGEDVEVFSFEALKKAWEDARLPSERAHVTPYIRNHPELFKLANLNSPRDLSKKRWTLDEPRDYEFIKLIYRRLYKKKRFFGIKDILKLLETHPEYEVINNNITRNEGLLKSLREDKSFNEEVSRII